ncbi:hypothetical protein [Bacillus sp. SG-1]|nr:hypothetical protein [Bacillus sp. SG-1]EDL65711.1 hypothetical protein BSG1_12591 [Bacillus sp. SG-1]
MKWIPRKNKKPLIVFILIILFIAGVLDIIFEGLLFQLLPDAVQAFLKG